jgi:hypothetical protein
VKPAQRCSRARGMRIRSWPFPFGTLPKSAAMGRNERWKCHLMSSDYEDDDQYTPTIDDKLTQGKISMSSFWANDQKCKA